MAMTSSDATTENELTIRALRKEKGFTLSQLAGAAGISESLLSQVERGRVDPSLATLRSIARSLEIPLFELFAEQQSAPQVDIVRAGLATEVTSPDGGLVYSRMSRVGGLLEVLKARLSPGASSHSEPWTHPAEECIVVLAGELHVEVEGDKYRLNTGDSCYFNSRLPHRFLNESAKEAVYIIAVTPPSY